MLNMLPTKELSLVEQTQEDLLVRDAPTAES